MAFATLPSETWVALPVARTSETWPSTKPSSPSCFQPATSGLVSAMPSNTFEARSLFRLTARLVTDSCCEPYT